MQERAMSLSHASTLAVKHTMLTSILTCVHEMELKILLVKTKYCNSLLKLECEENWVVGKGGCCPDEAQRMVGS